MAFVEFKRDLRHSGRPFISIGKDGLRIGLSLEAAKSLGVERGDWVSLLFDEGSATEPPRLGIRKDESGEFRPSPGARGFQISAADFLARFPIRPGRYAVKVMGGVLTCDVKMKAKRMTVVEGGRS